MEVRRQAERLDLLRLRSHLRGVPEPLLLVDLVHGGHHLSDRAAGGGGAEGRMVPNRNEAKLSHPKKNKDDTG